MSAPHPAGPTRSTCRWISIRWPPPGRCSARAAVIVIDEATPILDVLERVAKFYAHESCGQCTPCRIGTSWINKIVKRMAAGDGEQDDVDDDRPPGREHQGPDALSARRRGRPAHPVHRSEIHEPRSPERGMIIRRCRDHRDR